MTGSRHQLLGVAALVATAALWGSNHVVARAVRETVPLPALVFWRWILGAGLLTVLALPALRRAWPAIRPRLREICVGGVFGVGIFSYLLLGGAYQSLALEVGIINATTPVWVALLGLRKGAEPFGARNWGGLALAMAGTLLIISKGHPEAIAGLQFNLGNLWSLLAAMLFAWFSIHLREWTRTVDTLSLTVVTAWSGIIVVMLPVYLIWLATGGAWLVWDKADTATAVAAIAYVGIGPTMLGNLFYLFGVATNGPARAATFLYLSPAFSALLAIVFLGEQLSWFHAVGFATIIVGLLQLRTAPRLP